MTGATCTWCGKRVDTDDGWRASEPAGARVATFCRLEHVFPWWAKGPHWDAGSLPVPRDLEDSLTGCAYCGEPLPDKYVVLMRHRGEHRIPDAFCSTEHMAQWAKRGGRWAP